MVVHFAVSRARGALASATSAAAAPGLLARLCRFAAVIGARFLSCRAVLSNRQRQFSRFAGCTRLSVLL
jgi:hypothetical protein